MSTAETPRTIETTIPVSAAPHLRELFEETSRPFRREPHEHSSGGPDILPRCPLSPRDAGLTLDQICELLLRHLLLEPIQRGIDLCRKLKLSWPVIEPACKTLQRAGCVEIGKGPLLPESTERLSLTGPGREQARKSFERCRYVGPAPVSLEDYAAHCRGMAPREWSINPNELRIALSGLCFDDDLFDALGSALCAAGSLLLASESGNGKSLFAKRLALAVQRSLDPICVPYAVRVEGTVMTVFDPRFHLPVAWEQSLLEAARFPNDASHESWKSLPDSRWRMVHRPRVVYTAERAEAEFAGSLPDAGTVWDAPSHVKANGGALILDDWDRYSPTTRSRIERVLDERVDARFGNGHSIALPVETFVIACQRDARRDGGLSRRFDRRIDLPGPTIDQLTDLLLEEGAGAGLDLNRNEVRRVFSENYPPGRPYHFSDPHNLLETLLGICRFRDRNLSDAGELLELAARRSAGLPGRRSA